MEILTDQQQGVSLTCTQQEALERRERVLAALRRVKVLERVRGWQGVEQGQERRNRVLECRVEPDHLGRHLRGDGGGSLALLQAPRAPEQTEHREVGGDLPIRHGGTVE